MKRNPAAIVIYIATLLVTGAIAAPLFVQAPVISANGSGGYWVEFRVSEATDVEVAVIDTATGAVVRHIGAGILGANAPAPFAPDSLHQKLAWDGKDDLLRAVASAGACKARVRAGLSLALDNIVGQNDYVFYRAIQGLAVDSTGALFAFGAFPWLAHHGTGSMVLRKYTRSGDYDRTIWPVQAGLNPTALSLLHVLTLPGNQYILKSDAMDAPQFSNVPMTYENSFICQQIVDGKIVVVDYPSMRFMTLNMDGSPAATNFLARSPTVPPATASGRLTGPGYLTLSPDKSYYLLSGCYYADSSGSGCFPASTGVWRDGQVFKIDVATGAVTTLIALAANLLPATDAARRSLVGPTTGDLGYMAAIHGTAFDDSGHIFICDRLNNEVGVYNTSGVRVGGLAVTGPDQVGINRKTGAVYVMTRQFSYGFNNSYPPPSGNGTIRLYKFASWRATSGQNFNLGKALAGDSKPAAKAAAVMDMEKKAGLTYGRLNMAVDGSGAQGLVWVNGSGGANYCADSTLVNIRCFRDDGNAFTLVKDFAPLTSKACTGFDRIMVDRKTENVYVNNSWNATYKIEDWSKPVFARCSTSAHVPLPATDMAISPDGFLYIHENLYDGPVTRYTLDHLHAPANFVGRGTNVVVTTVHLGYGAGTQDHGIAVTRDGKLYTCNGSYLAATLQKYDTTGTLLKDNVIGLGLPAGDLKLDNAGKLYIAASIRPATMAIPAAYTGYWPYTYSTGAIVKFDPDSSGAFTNVADGDPANRGVSKALKVYNMPVSPFGGASHSAVYVPSSTYGCVCRHPHFDVDGFGRIFAPHTVIGRVTVADNAGNEILSFGEYGNADSRGPGSLVPGPAVPLSWPAGVAASDNYIYVTDLVNARLVRLKMNFVLDNLPVEGSRFAARHVSALMLQSFPEPFHGVSSIAAGIPLEGKLKLDVLDMQGRQVCLIFEGRKPAGIHEFRWNATGNNGRSVAPGMYFYRVTAGSGTLLCKTLYLR